ncbi:Uncharacterized protein APZ42_005544, partial [Daphnia magna]
FKRALGVSHNDWLQLNPGKRITVKEIAELTKPAYVAAFTPANIISAFRTTGIEPFNRFAIPEERYAPSLVTDRDCPIDNVVEKLVPPPVSDLSNDYIEVIHPPV